jgi:hypothetical protein
MIFKFAFVITHLPLFIKRLGRLLTGDNNFRFGCLYSIDGEYLLWLYHYVSGDVKFFKNEGIFMRFALRDKE